METACLLQVIEESQGELAKVEQHLRALGAAYPEVLASVRTKQVAQEMLLVKEQYVHELKASGGLCQPMCSCNASSCSWHMCFPRLKTCVQRYTA